MPTHLENYRTHFYDKKFFTLDIRVIANRLGKLCRFSGATNRFYSVAEHCVHISTMVGSGYRLAALLHDAAEAYTGDIINPVKANYTSDFKALEREIEQTICDCFMISPIRMLSEQVKTADYDLWALEMRLLVLTPDEDFLPYEDLPQAVKDKRLMCWSPLEASLRFMQRYAEITENADEHC